jgi:ribose 5-phosphate isomerase B
VRVYLGSDHAGFELKSVLANWLSSAGHEVTDCGPASYHEHDDYPPYDPDSVAIVIGGSGNGEQIAANKIAGIRAALVWSEETARLARLHNDANVLSLGARMHPAADAIAFTQVFLATSFSGELRHVRRLEMIADYEVSGDLPPLPGWE